MADRKSNFFHGHREPAPRATRGEDAARIIRTNQPSPAPAADPSPALSPRRKLWSIFHPGPAWPARRAPDDPQ